MTPTGMSYQNHQSKAHNDPLLTVYQTNATKNEYATLQGSNVISSTFVQPQYRTNVPGRQRIQEEYADA